jgi:hypothetical protein
MKPVLFATKRESSHRIYDGEYVGGGGIGALRPRPASQPHPPVHHPQRPVHHRRVDPLQGSVADPYGGRGSGSICQRGLDTDPRILPFTKQKLVRKALIPIAFFYFF